MLGNIGYFYNNPKFLLLDVQDVINLTKDEIKSLEIQKSIVEEEKRMLQPSIYNYEIEAIKLKDKIEESIKMNLPNKDIFQLQYEEQHLNLNIKNKVRKVSIELQRLNNKIKDIQYEQKKLQKLITDKEEHYVTEHLPLHNLTTNKGENKCQL